MSKFPASRHPHPSDAPDRPAAPIKPVPPARRISSRELLEGGRELVIQHLDREYHLRLTRNDKLILTK